MDMLYKADNDRGGLTCIKMVGCKKSFLYNHLHVLLIHLRKFDTHLHNNDRGVKTQKCIQLHNGLNNKGLYTHVKMAGQTIPISNTICL